jgi:hypothetical protein
MSADQQVPIAILHVKQKTVFAPVRLVPSSVVFFRLEELITARHSWCYFLTGLLTWSVELRLGKGRSERILRSSPVLDVGIPHDIFKYIAQV